ncbi:FAD binding domain-containing protein [Amorphus coralli]|uniref:FAD binding domain-containing protein n=1 Tax=Amorphus coralli TaxID=340680 RepID=UPI000365348F|nr:FAD binding domain-containing protein [Amorphus coralli]
MKPALFDYVRPDSLQEALEVLARYGGEAEVIAGGQSLMPLLASRVRTPRVLIDIARIGAQYATIHDEEGHLSIGALARHADVIVDRSVVSALPMLTHAGRSIGNRAIRNRGTFGGSLAFADPVAEWPLCLVALGGTVELASTSRLRRVAAEDFLHGAFQTDCRPDELIIRAVSPLPRFAHFDEISARPTAPALASVAVASAGQGQFRVALGAVADRPILLEHAALAAFMPNPDWRAVRSLLEDEVGDRLPTSERSYRLHLALALLRRAARAYEEFTSHVRR